ncbi:MAG TPA: glycosyltransferase family 4 protein [Solirubrobacteraceae bacterium]|nr:glycosyltransferase family 4 protein [Solirubrobacteraceae bacterium]
MVTIHHLADYAGPYPGSFVPMLAATTREASRRGYRNTIWLSAVARDRAWLSELDGLAEIRWLDGDRGSIGSIRPTLAALGPALAAGGEPAVLHTHFGTFDIPAALMRLRRRRLAVFWHEHSRLHDTRAARARNTARYLMLGRVVNGMLCVSPEIRDALRERHAPAGRLIDFPNAIDIDRFALVTPERRRAARQELGLADDERVVLHFGWDWHRKGGDLMVAAAATFAADEGVRWLTVLGAGAPPPELAGSPAVRGLPPTDDVSALYAAADIFLSCSRAEGMPYAVLEALASGLPVVGTDLPGQTPLLAGLPGGEVVAAAPAAIAAAVRRLLALRPDERERHAQQARERVAASYSLDAWSRNLVDLYGRALGPGAPLA